MKILHLSDTHGFHDLRVDEWLDEMIEEHEPDTIVHSGDFMRHAMKFQDLIDFFNWFRKFDVKHKIIIPGNHDMWCEQLEKNDYLRNATVPDDLILLINEEVTIDGLKFWGSPYTPEFNNWGFQLYKDDGEKLWATIPDDVDILITHGPAHGTLDRVDENSLFSGTGSLTSHLGCPFLRDRIKELKILKAHLFGHIHGGQGRKNSNGYIALNSAVLDEDYKVVNKPQLVEI